MKSDIKQLPSYW